jgi:hypothetical protein
VGHHKKSIFDTLLVVCKPTEKNVEIFGQKLRQCKSKKKEAKSNLKFE